MQRTLLVRYPACTRPAMPVLAAVKKPPVNTTAGMMYNGLYSGGSVGPMTYKRKHHAAPPRSMRRTLEHIQHPLGDHEASSDVDTSEEDRQGTQNLWYSAREVATSHYEKTTDTDQPY